MSSCLHLAFPLSSKSTELTEVKSHGNNVCDIIIAHVKSGDRWIDRHGKRKSILGPAGNLKKATFSPPFCSNVTHVVSHIMQALPAFLYCM